MLMSITRSANSVSGMSGWRSRATGALRISGRTRKALRRWKRYISRGNGQLSTLARLPCTSTRLCTSNWTLTLSR